MIIVITFLLAAVLETARRQKRRLLVQEYRYRLFTLRDELRDLAISEPDISKSWVFQYLDSTISKWVTLIPQLSVWFVLGVYLTHKNDKGLGKLRKNLNAEYGRARNRQLKKKEEELTAILSQYLMSRHVLMLVTSFVVVALPLTLAAQIKKWKKQSVKLIVEAPESSTLLECSPQGASC